MSNYKKTLNLPRTAFPMRARLAERKPRTLAHWEKMGAALSFSLPHPWSHARATGLLPNSALPVRAHRLRNADALRKKIKQGLEAALSLSPSHRQTEEYSGKSQ